MINNGTNRHRPSVQIRPTIPFLIYLVNTAYNHYVHIPWGDSPYWAKGFLIIEASRSHSDTPHSVGLLWTSDQPDTKT